MTVLAPELVLRPATPDDAPHLATLINYAGEGLPHYLWSQMAERGETAWDVGKRRACRTEGGFSWCNAHLAEVDGGVAATLIGYPLPEIPEAVDYATLPPLFAPLQELEDLAPGTWYINVLAAHPEYRSRGIGTRLIGRATELARSAGCADLSLIVSDANPGARRLYERCGFVERASRAAVKEGWDNPIKNWVLMVTG